MERRQFDWRQERAFVALLLVVALGYVGVVVPTVSSLSVDWREADVLIVGRNLCRGEGNLWMPRINAGGDSLGITGMEFPILNALGAVWACGTGGQVITARLLTMLFALLGLGSLGWLARRFLSLPGVAVALVVFAFSPILLFYGRATQPDVPSLGLALFSMALLESALVPAGRTRWGLYLLSALVMALGALIKLPAVVFGLPMVAMVWVRRGPAALRDARYWLFLPIALGPAAVWYVHARELQTTYGIVYFFLGSSWEVLLRDWLNPAFWERLFVRQLFDTYAAPFASAIAILTFAWGWRRMPVWVPLMGVAAVVFLLLGGWVAAWHNCYGVMAVPAIALAAGFGAEQLLSKSRSARVVWPLLGLLIAATLGYGVWRSARWFWRSETQPAFEVAKSALDGRLDPSERVVALSDGDPKALWYFDRKGWVFSENFWSWIDERNTGLPRAAVVDAMRLKRAPGRWETTRQVLQDHGYRVLHENETVEVWLLESRQALQ